jgi:hypothetical protein
MNTCLPEDFCRPIGRDKELKQFQSILHRKVPGLVIVRGEQGMGKSTFLNMIADQAKQVGWTVLLLKPDLNSELDVRSFAKELEEGLKETSGLEAGSAPKPTQTLIEKLKRKSPLLILIDGYRASSQFTSWFTSEFTPGITKIKAPVIVLVADRPGSVDTLVNFASRKIEIGDINRIAVKQLLKHLNTCLELRMEAAELEPYANEIAKRPFLFEPLIRVLLLGVK